MIDYIKSLGAKKKKGRRLLSTTVAATSDEANKSGCGQNMYENKDPNVQQVTTDMAVAEWYSQKQYYNAATQTKTAGKEKEADEYLNVVYKDTESTGFGVQHPYVVGWYCPKAKLDAASLKT